MSQKMGVGIVRAMVVGWMLAAGSACLAQTITSEVEPNDDKAHATPIAAMAPGDSFTGTTTGSFTNNGGALNTADVWDITTTAAPSAGIWKYTLTIDTDGTWNYSGSILGLTQNPGPSGGVVGTSTTAAQSVGSTSIIHTVSWYANQNPSRIYFRITGLSTSSPYKVTLSRDQVTPNVVYTPIDAGPLYISTIGQTTANTDLWIYDSNFVPIPGAGNDNESIAGGGTGTTTQSRLQRNLPAGTYILAIAAGNGATNLANNLASPADENSQTGVVLDFPNAVCTSYTSTLLIDGSFVIGNRCTGQPQQISNTGIVAEEVRFYQFTLAGPQLADPTIFAPGVASPAALTPGSSTVLSVAASGGTPTGVTADLSAFGLSSSVAFHDDGTNGDAVAGDNIWSYRLNVPAGQAPGVYTVNVTSTVNSACLAPTGSVTVDVTPVNNSCANAIPIVVGGSYPGTTIGAVGSGGMSLTCAGRSGTNPGVWYTFTETSLTPRRLVASLCDPVTNFDGLMVLYTLTNPSLPCGDGNFTCIWSNDTSWFGCPYQNPSRNAPGINGHSDIPAIVNWTPGTPELKCTVPGTTYYIGVLNSGLHSGNFVLHMDDTGETCQGTPPSNDLCVNARDLGSLNSGQPVWDLVFREDATPDAKVSCSDPANTSARGSTWYAFTPTGPGNFFHVKIPDQYANPSDLVPGSKYDTVVTVFTGNCAGGLTEVACSDYVDSYQAFGSPFVTPVVAMQANTRYLIEISQQSADASQEIPAGEYLGFNFVSTGPSPCCRSDYNGDGDIGTDQDIESFFACLAGNCCATCPPTADFNCDGDIGTDADIESFFRVLAGGAC
jgi:hypothetical protein